MSPIRSLLPRPARSPLSKPALLRSRNRWSVGAVLAISAAAGLIPSRAASAKSPAAAQSGPPPAVAQMMAPGAEEQLLARRAGIWDVTATFRAEPDAKPVITTGLVAERILVGPYLQEIMRPAPGSQVPDFRRIAYLTYSRVEGRWQYVSLDTRLPVGIMPAQSFGKEVNGKLTLHFESLGFVGFGPEVSGRMMRSNLVISRPSNDRELVQQHWVQADGTGREWLAVQYEYTRKPVAATAR